MRRSAKLALVATTVVGLVAVGAGVWHFATPPRAEPRPIVEVSEYQRHEEILLNSAPYKGPLNKAAMVSRSPEIGAVQYYLPPAPAFLEHATLPPQELLAGAHSTQPFIAEGVSGTTLEQRAITDTVNRVYGGLNVNVLLGVQYAFGVTRHADLNTTKVDTGREGFDQYVNPILYMERGSDSVVLVTYYFSGESNKNVREIDRFTEAADGTHWLESINGRFLRRSQTHRTWVAREFRGVCQAAPVSSSCLYKARQHELTLQDHDQVIVVGKPNLLEYDLQYSQAGDRKIETLFSTTILGKGELRLAEGYDQYTDDGRRVLDRFKRSQQQGGIVVYDAPQIAGLPAFTTT